MGFSGFSALDRRTIEAVVASDRRLLVQGAMGLHASDGLAGKVARARSTRFVCAGTISGVGKTPEMLRREIGRARALAPGGHVGVNLVAAINHDDFAQLAHVAIEERVSFLVQGAGISREVVRWCRDAETPFGGIVSSGRLAATYERWGADFLVAEGGEAGGHIGDVDSPLTVLLDEVKDATRLPRGLFYTGQSVTRIPERTVDELKTVQELIDDLEETVAAPVSPARTLGFAEAAP